MSVNSGQPEFDYIIAGHGLAGALLAQTLRQKNLSVLVVDPDNSEPTASRVAAGMFNPVTGHRLVKTWQADTIFPFLNTFYKNLETEIGARFFFPMPIYRPFKSLEEQNNIFARSAEPDLVGYLDLEPKNIPEGVVAPYGGFNIMQGGFVDTNVLLNSLKSVRISERAFRQGTIEPSEIIKSNNGIEWNRIKAKAVIFCNGYKAASHPYFKSIPFQPLKGETLLCKSENQDFKQNGILNGGGVYVVPLSENKVRIGATYEHFYKTEQPTQIGKNNLLTDVALLSGTHWQVIDHQAGIRPAMRGRRPVIGFLPDDRPIAIFNGMGSKGVSLIPWLAEQFAQFLMHKKPLPKEVEIERFTGR